MSSHFERLASAPDDRYRLDREVGRGGMATVGLAEGRRQAAGQVDVRSA